MQVTKIKKEESIVNVDLEKIDFSERFSFGLGDFGTNLMYALMVTFLTYFYTDTVGISAALTGTIMFGVRILDTIVGLIVGTLVDKTQSKMGKSRPWVFWTAIPFGVSGFLMSTVPDIGYNGKVIYVIITYVLVNIIFEASNIPYGSLVSLISRDSYERSVLSIFRNFLSTIGSMLVGVITLPLVAFFGDNQQAWIITFGIYGFFTALCLIVTSLGTKERVKPVYVPKEKVRFKKVLKTIFENKYWLMIFFYLLFYFVYLTASSTITVYYAEYILHDKTTISWISLAQSLPVFAVLLVISPVIKRIGKRNTAIIGGVITLIGILLPLFDTTNLSLIIFASVLKGIGGAPLGATMFAFLADTIDYGEWISRIRMEGILFSAGTVGQTLGMGLGSAVVGWLLGASGFISGSSTQALSVLNMIVLLFIAVPAIVIIINLFILWRFKLDKIYPQIVSDLSNKRYKER